LRQPYRGLKLGHAVVVRKERRMPIDYPRAPVVALVRPEPQAVRQVGVIGDDDTAVAARDVLVLVQAETADPTDRAGRPGRMFRCLGVPILAAERLRAVFD
jgi:hypothetical protein